jgi:hypothetical protein
LDKLGAMKGFVRIVEQGSLTAAAADLDVSLPSMVRTLAALERDSSNADRDWDNAISSCGPIVPPCPPANDAFPVRRARIVAARLDTYRPSSPTASTWFRASQSIPCWSRGPDPTSPYPPPQGA